MKNICISDSETGIIVFQKVYKWKESSAFYNLGGLIQVFYQFAREVDDGEISCVNFESGRKISTRLSHDHQQAKNQTMQMKSIKTDDIIVSVFFDMQGMEMPTWEEDLKLDVLMHTVKEAFLRDHLTNLLEKRPTLQQEMEEKNDNLTNEETESRPALPFEDFAPIADRLRHQLFPLQDNNTTSNNVGNFSGSSNKASNTGVFIPVNASDIVLSEALTIEEHVQMQLALLHSK